MMTEILNVLLKTSVSGGIVILFWFVTYPVSRRIFKASWHYSILKLSMLLLILPLAALTPQPKTAADIPEFPAVSLIPLLPQDLGLQYLVLILPFVAMMLAVIEISKVLRLYKFIALSCAGEADEEMLAIFEGLKPRRNISLRTSEYIKSPFTVGLFKPVIYMPKADMNREETELSLIHELTHIKNGDLWFKFFSVIVSILHWFNPLVHLLRIKISAVSEFYCDECVTAEMSKKERMNYGELLIKTAYGEKPSNKSLYAPLSHSSRRIKRRLSQLMETQKPRRIITALSVIIAVFVFVFAAVQAIAPNVAFRNIEFPQTFFVLELQPPDEQIDIIPEESMADVADIIAGQRERNREIIQ
jgi:beta-lactamase regulating signal transducer with metallopeptidase domain